MRPYGRLASAVALCAALIVGGAACHQQHQNQNDQDARAGNSSAAAEPHSSEKRTMNANVAGKTPHIDKSDFGWINVEGQVTQSFSMGLFVARVQRGSHIILEQTCVGESVWVPKRLQLRFSAKILLLKSLNIDRILTYSDYRPEADSPSSVCR